MHNLVKENILTHNLINSGDNILIGLSGGPDSIFLFHNLRLLKNSLNFNLYASHINHMYRGEDAVKDEEFVRNLCNEYDIELFVKRKNAKDTAIELKVTDEEAGRILRYNFFRENLNEIGGGKIAVAHNLNDQAETVLQRIIRGTGIEGLSAMSFISNEIIRPILNVERTEIEKYLEENNYEFCIDKTNLQDIYGRNKIRLNLLPFLKENFNPNIQNTLFRLSEAASNDLKIINKYTEEKIQNIIFKKDQNEIILDLNKLNDLESYETGRIIKKAIEILKGNTINIEMKHIEYVNEFIKAGKTGKSIDLTEGLTVEISYNNFIIRKMVEKTNEFQYNIIINEPLYINETGHTVFCKIIDASEFKNDNITDKNNIYLDFDLIKGILTARNRRNGDSMIPCGMNGTKKVKDILIDLKIPVNDRNKKLIISDEKNILWLQDYRISNEYKISEKTKKILNVSIREDENEKWH